MATTNQLKRMDIDQKQRQFEASHAEAKRANRAQESIGRTNASANVMKAVLSPFKFKVGGAVNDFPLRNALNHISWYTHSPEQAKAVATLPYVTTKGGHKWYFAEDDSVITTKGWCILEYVDVLPVINGSHLDRSSPVNMLTQNLFSTLRSKVSGALNFEASDYLMYIMSVGSYYSAWAYLCNLYGLMNFTEGDTLYTKRDLAAALGIDWQSFTGNKLAIMTAINDLGAVLSNLAIPTNLDYFARKLWLTSNVFVDNKSLDKACLYMFKPSAFYRYSDGHLDNVPFGDSTTPWTSAQIITFIYTLIDTIVSNDTWIDMSGQTKRAFENSYFTFPTVQMAEGPKFVYDEDILRQVQSATLAPRPLTLTISQVTDPESINYGLIYQGTLADGLDYTITNSFGYQNGAPEINGVELSDYITSNEESVSYEDVMRQTRLRCAWSSSFAAGKATVRYEQVGTEIVHGITFVSHSANGSVNLKYASILYNAGHTLSSLVNYIEAGEYWGVFADKFAILATLIGTYHYCPLILMNVHDTENSNCVGLCASVPHVNNVLVPVTSETLGNINRVATASMFGVYDNLTKK